MKFLSRAALGLAIAPLFAGAAMANLVTNGDFESGNTGFTSSYTNNQADCTGPAVYAVNGNAQSCHPSFVAVTPHGGQLMMTLNGATTSGVEVWNSGPITVVNGGLYNFSAWATSVYPNDPADLEFLINGVSIGTLQLTSGTPDWSQFSQNWFANTTSATLSIIDLDLGFDGNDFAIDDISFDPIRIPNQVPEPMTLALIGAGLAGLGFGRRRS
jgi:hypothetical protein